VVDWGRLLSGYRGEILGRRFESCPPRHQSNAFRKERVVFLSHCTIYFRLNFIPRCDPWNPSLS
jgi:hypothetical protein